MKTIMSDRDHVIRIPMKEESASTPYLEWPSLPDNEVNRQTVPIGTLLTFDETVENGAEITAYYEGVSWAS